MYLSSDNKGSQQELRNEIQNDLFDIGADLCIPSLDKAQTQRYACHNFEQAQIMLMEWLRVGWPAYLVSPQGEDNIFQAGF